LNSTTDFPSIVVFVPTVTRLTRPLVAPGRLSVCTNAQRPIASSFQYALASLAITVAVVPPPPPPPHPQSSSTTAAAANARNALIDPMNSPAGGALATRRARPARHWAGPAHRPG
jgi:hypothetical protein